MERECLEILLRGTQGVILCPARTLTSLRLSASAKKALADGRLLLLSPFDESVRRQARDTAIYRNRVVAALADEIIVPYALPGGATDDLCRAALAWGKALFTFDSPANRHLVQLGASVLVAPTE